MLGLDTVKSVIATTESLIRMFKLLAHGRQVSRAKAVHIKRLFGFLADADVTTGRTPRDDIHSLQLFRNWLLHHFRYDRTITYTDQLMPPDLSKHLCTIGGPVDHPHTRYALGYDYSGERWNQVLPFFFPLTKPVSYKRPVLRLWEGESWPVRKWFISDRHGRPQFIPASDRNGYLNKDYLMLLVVPNTFTEEAFYSGQKHMVIAATHGLAQLAVKDVLDNDAILKELIEVRERSECFQAIIEVTASLTGDGRSYIPSDYAIAACEPLDVGEFVKFVRFGDWLRL